MGTATLTIDLGALSNNWRALDSRGAAETAAVVKADAYGLGADRISRALARAGARTFFVATTEEGASLREALGPGPVINVFSGHMSGDTDMIADMALTPMINSLDQLVRHVESLPGHPFGIQLDTGMNRLGMEATEWSAVREIALQQNPTVIMSHLACADEPEHEMNAAQLATFHEMADGIDAPLSLANTGGILLDKAYHLNLTRPGIGLYGGLPFADASPVVSLKVPVIQCRDVAEGESVGYGNSFIADRPSRIATIAAGYADGVIRSMGPKTVLYSEDQKCPVAGRISMDMIGVDITDLNDPNPKSLDLLGPMQGVDTLADAAGTIGYEILTSLGARYNRRYVGA